MSISEELKAKILRYYHVEKWRVGTISRELSVHHSTIKRVLTETGVPKGKIRPNTSMIDPYLEFIVATLEKHPSLAGSRLYDMVCERGYPGGADHFRHLISLYRPRVAAEAFLRLRTLPGEQAQVDWAHFDYLIIGKAKRPVMAFVMVLSYSRKIFLRFYLNQRMSNFLRGHEAAFEAWGGVPKVILYDNLKSAVLERCGDAIRFHPTLLEFSKHYRYEPRPVAVYRGNEKGRVERAIRYVRDNFFPAREWKDITDLNQQAEIWCNGTAANRPCPEDRSHSVKTIFLEEQPTLITLPAYPFPTDEQEAVNVGKTPYVRFDLNDYSVPHTHVSRTLNVLATMDRIKIMDGIDVIAEHNRSYDKGQQIEDQSHLAALIGWKKQANENRSQDRLIRSVPNTSALLKQAAALGYSLKSITKHLILLLEDYGSTELECAVNEAVEKKTPHPNSLQIILERRREKQNKCPPIRLPLPDDPRIKNQVVRPHSLHDYDIKSKPEESDDS